MICFGLQDGYVAPCRVSICLSKRKKIAALATHHLLCAIKPHGSTNNNVPGIGLPILKVQSPSPLPCFPSASLHSKVQHFLGMRSERGIRHPASTVFAKLISSSFKLPPANTTLALLTPFIPQGHSQQAGEIAERPRGRRLLIAITTPRSVHYIPCFVYRALGLALPPFPRRFQSNFAF